MASGTDLTRFPIHLRPGGSAVTQPEFTGDSAWYEEYATRHPASDGDGRLVALHAFSDAWEMWEMHPKGDEVVFCVSGTLTLHQEAPDGGRTTVTISAGEYAINPAGVWHTADVDSPATALFITPGEGTEHRPR